MSLHASLVLVIIHYKEQDLQHIMQQTEGNALSG
jgi:hypothetical protein